uniref:Uncharacterized protein n=1 Tax=Acrobeloides nanus TaxID=290746 RepID=A0A914BYC1_9BILA
MLPFGGPPGFPLLNNPQAGLFSSPMLFTSLPQVMVSTANATLLTSTPGVNMLGNRPMMVPPNMLTDIAGNSTPSTPGNEPSVWSEHKTQDNRVYYYNRITKQSSWTKPDELKTTEERAASNWRVYHTPEGRPYYYNTETKKTTWTKPQELENLSQDKSSASTDTPPLHAMKQEAESANSGSELERAMAATLKNLEVMPPTTSEIKNEDEKKPTMTEDYEAELKKRQADKFRELLRDKNAEGRISSTSTWEQAVKYIQHDPRYGIITRISERKQIFNAWKTQRQKEEREEKRLAIKRAKDDLEQWLQQHPKMKPTFSYRKAQNLFGKEDVWNNVADSDRRDIFRDVQDLMEKKEAEKEQTTRDMNIKALSDILDAMPEVNHKTTWAQAQRLLVENPAFAEHPTLQEMDKIDALIVFEQHIRTAEKHYIKEKENEDKRLRRHERKVREAFNGFLEELNRKSILTSMSSWSELYPLVSADSRFEDMLMQSGSTALDLYKFYVEDLKEKYYQHRKIVKEILQDLNVEITIETTYDQVLQAIKGHEKGKSVDPGNLKLVYNSLMDKVEAKVKENEREQQRKQKRLESAFRNLLRSIVPPVEPSSSWSAIAPKIEHDQAYKDVPSDELRLQFFDSYIQSISQSCGHHHGSSSAKKKKKEKKKKRKHEDHDSDSDEETKPKKSKKEKSNNDGEKKKKKSKRRSKSRSKSHSEGEIVKPKVEETRQDEKNSEDSDLSADELEKKRKELLKKLSD